MCTYSPPSPPRVASPLPLTTALPLLSTAGPARAVAVLLAIVRTPRLAIDLVDRAGRLAALALRSRRTTGRISLA